MMWRNVSLDNIKGLQQAFLAAAILLGAILVATGPPLTNQLTFTVRLWGIGLVAAGVLGALGEVWISHGKSGYRWFAAWLAHVGLMAIYVGLAFDSLVNIGVDASTGLELLRAVVFGQIAWVHRTFIHWRSNAPQ